MATRCVFFFSQFYGARLHTTAHSLHGVHCMIMPVLMTISPTHKYCTTCNHNIQQHTTRPHQHHIHPPPPTHTHAQNGSSVNEVYATIALDALESADTLTTLDDVNNAVESLTAGSLQQQVNTTVSGASSPSLPYSSSSSSLSVHSEETQPVTNGAAGALESTTGAVAAATMTANPTTGVSNGVSIGVFGGVSSEYGEYEQQVAEEYADEVAGENAQDGAVNGVVAQAALALETEARAAAAAITVVEEDIKVVEEKENNIVTATETQQDVVKEEVEAAVEDVVQAKEETEVDGAEEDKQGEDVENEEEPTKKEAVAAAVGAAPGGVLGGLQLPESVAKVLCR